jgi:ATP-dependent helicase/nuclease subunit B
MTASTAGDASFWARLARQAQAWFAGEGVCARDAIVLLPFAQLLAPARAAFAQAGGWQPRIETTHTLLASLGPGASAGGPGHDVVADRLSAAALLRSQAWGAAWQRGDPRAFDQGVAALADTAQALARAVQAVAPPQRADWWARARAELAPIAGPGARERALARIALEWAASAEAPASDTLFTLRPRAWLLVQAGAADPLARALLAAATVPVRVIDADPPAGSPPPAAPALYVADDLEQEAQGAATLVLRALHDGLAPVALVAQDRVVVRRVRALLERRGIALHDETGWKLSTTRSAALVMAALRAALPQAGADARLDWLKSDPDADADRIAALEACWRRASPLPPDLHAWWQRTQGRLAPLQRTRASLAAWLTALAVVLPMPALRDDPAGRQLIAALHLDADDGWAMRAPAQAMDLDRFAAWVDDTLELQMFVPPAHSGAPVVITPLARVMLRPFGALVCPGTDELRLGAPPAPHPLLGERTLAALGLPNAITRRRDEWLAFAQLLQLPNVMLLRRASEDGEPLARSAFVEQLLTQREPAEMRVAMTLRRVVPTPLARPAPQALPPARLSASAVEALRDCPYRFFARVVLRLHEADELDAEVIKRDYGTWLHAVLLRFHSARDPAVSQEADLAALHAAADADDSGLDAAQLLPFRAAFASLAPRYVQWQRARDASGWRYAQGEVDASLPLPGAAGSELYGRIDRIDRIERPSAQRALIDYKTSRSDTLSKKVRDPLEDTQLAFYAALLGAPPSLTALYLALDERNAPQAVVHPDVAVSAAALLDGLAADLAQLRAGTGLPALGEEPVCGHCEMRGLCRRDHWSGPAP